jgi:hypothetical protein
MRALHSHHHVLFVIAPLLVTQLAPHFTGVLPFPALVSVVAPAIALLLFVTILVVFPFIDLLSLRSCPSNHGLFIVVISPILFPSGGSYDHDDSSFIPVRISSPTHLRSYCAALCTCTLAWWFASETCHSLLPYVTCCMKFVVCTFPRAFPAIIYVARVMLSYPRWLFMLILHGHW